jgi:hypothetical protein
MDKLSVMVNYIEMARVTGVPLNYLLTRGQQIKVLLHDVEYKREFARANPLTGGQVFSMLLRKCRRDSLLVPNLPKSQGDDTTYEGATVIEPMKVVIPHKECDPFVYIEIFRHTMKFLSLLWILRLCIPASCRPTIYATAHWSPKMMQTVWYATCYHHKSSAQSS